MRVEEPVRYLHLAGQGHPLVLGVEAGDQADGHQLEGEGGHRDQCKRNEDEEEVSAPIKLGLALVSHVVGPLDDDAQRPEDAGKKEDDEHLNSPDWIGLKALLLAKKEACCPCQSLIGQVSAVGFVFKLEIASSIIRKDAELKVWP